MRQTTQYSCRFQAAAVSVLGDQRKERILHVDAIRPGAMSIRGGKKCAALRFDIDTNLYGSV